MKNLILILFSITALNAQDNFDVIINIGLDPKMITQGAHKGREGNKPSLDFEIGLGIEWENTRLLMKYKNHQAINFSKWTYFAFDYRKELLRNVYGFAGLEMGQISRRHPDAHWSKPDNYREVTINPIIFGANLEMQYKISRSIGLSLHFAIYQSEDEVREFKKYRKDVNAKISFYL